MNIRCFLAEQKVSIMLQLIVLIVVNVYFLILDTGNQQKGDLIYLDVLLMFFYIGGFYISYRKWKDRYETLYRTLEEDGEIRREEIEYQYVAEEIMRYILDTKDSMFQKEQGHNEERIKEMEEYISKWVHEIKLPISALNMMAERIEEDTIGSNIKYEVEKINFLVESVLYGSRATASAEDLFIREEHIEDMVRTAVRQSAFFLIRHNIEVKMDNLNFEVYTDKKWMIYVIEQMVNNAIKYAKLNGQISFYGEEEDKYVILNIKDNGIGIAEEDRKRIFNKSFTGKNGRNTTYKSTGMGLYFCKKILDKLGHGVEVESIEGEYTLFRIKFYKISDYMKVAKM